MHGRRIQPGRSALTITVAAMALLTACTTESSSPGRTKATGSAASGAAPTPTWNTRPASIAALGDSITRAFDACELLKDCPNQSWVSVLARRLSARQFNLAQTGARMADLVGQAEQAVASRPQQVVILMGSNDACRRTTTEMTPTHEYRRQFTAAMDVLNTGLPKTQVFVASVPDPKRLLDVGRKIPVAKAVWQLAKTCPSMLAEPDSTAASDLRRRDAVRARVMEYNTALSEVCGQYSRCRYDGGTVFGFRFVADQLSPFDWFHPGKRGQAELARVITRAGFSSVAVTE
jgi:lysophospholipase L1-like esterase